MAFDDTQTEPLFITACGGMLIAASLPFVERGRWLTVAHAFACVGVLLATVGIVCVCLSFRRR